MYMKHCKILLEPIAQKKDKKKGTKTDKKVVHVEREDQRDPEVEILVTTRWTKEVSKLVMRCFYQSDPIIIRGYRKRMIVIWREKATFEITEQNC